MKSHFFNHLFLITATRQGGSQKVSENNHRSLGSLYKGVIGRIHSYEHFDTPQYSPPVFLFFRHPNFSSIGRNGRTGHNQNLYIQNYKWIYYALTCKRWHYYITPIARIFCVLLVYHTCLTYKVSITLGVFLFLVFHTCLLYCLNITHVAKLHLF